MVKPYFIAISGIMGSGKTTLARNLSYILGWDFLPGKMEALKFIDDLFFDPIRWAFDTQLSFFVNKSLMIIEKINRNRNIILDRTLFEDSSIFAKYFYDRGEIDSRSYETYKKIADHFLGQIPHPDLIIHCLCSLEQTKERIFKRNRGFQKRYPPNHLEDINDLYKTWIDDLNSIPLYTVDSDAYDFREFKTIDNISDDILSA